MSKYGVIRWLAYILEIVVSYVLQETPGLIPQIFGARPVLVVPVVLAIAMFETEITAMLFGLFGGLLIDFGMGSLLGFHAILLAALSFCISLIAANLIRTNLLSAMIVVLISEAVLILLDWACFYVMPGYGEPFYTLEAHYLYIYLYTSAVMPVTYYFNRALALQIRSKEE
jgi:rod shape-determining protein MreD